MDLKENFSTLCPCSVPCVQEAKDFNISVWFFFKSNLALEDECLNENEYSEILAGFLSFSRVKINSCYACKILNNEMQTGVNLPEVGQAMFVQCKSIKRSELLRSGRNPLWRGPNMWKVGTIS